MSLYSKIHLFAISENEHIPMCLLVVFAPFLKLRYN